MKWATAPTLLGGTWPTPAELRSGMKRWPDVDVATERSLVSGVAALRPTPMWADRRICPVAAIGGCPLMATSTLRSVHGRPRAPRRSPFNGTWVAYLTSMRAHVRGRRRSWCPPRPSIGSRLSGQRGMT